MAWVRRDLQPEAVVAAVENMLEKGAHKKFFYLSIDFVRDKAANPKQEIHQQEILAAYPKIKELALRGSARTPTSCPRAPSPCACTRWAAGAR
jgi:hypothetical protein